jgi:hypothetical protein
MSSRFIEPPPDNSLQTFLSIKQAANKNWRRIKIENNAYGFQIQPGTKWREGLTEAALTEFEKVMGYEFPPALKNYYLTMNGLDTPGINVHGTNGYPATYGPIFYSYPDDLNVIEETIDWVLGANVLRIVPDVYRRFCLSVFAGSVISTRLSVRFSCMVFTSFSLTFSYSS